MKKILRKVNEKLESMTNTEAVLLGVSLGLLYLNVRGEINYRKIVKCHNGLKHAYYSTHVVIKDSEIAKILAGTPHRFDFRDGITLHLTKLIEGE